MKVGDCVRVFLVAAPERFAVGEIVLVSSPNNHSMIVAFGDAKPPFEPGKPPGGLSIDPERGIVLVLSRTPATEPFYQDLMAPGPYYGVETPAQGAERLAR